jgi:hypothetical protein
MFDGVDSEGTGRTGSLVRWAPRCASSAGGPATSVGSGAMGGPAGQRYLCPEGLSRPAAPHKVQASLSAFHAMMQRHPDTHTLLASHGHDLAGQSLRQLLHGQPFPIFALLLAALTVIELALAAACRFHG